MCSKCIVFSKTVFDIILTEVEYVVPVLEMFVEMSRQPQVVFSQRVINQEKLGPNHKNLNIADN